jgi:hypothetical protein
VPWNPQDAEAVNQRQTLEIAWTSFRTIARSFTTLPPPVRLGVGVAAWAAFAAHGVARGRAAAARGLTGALGERDGAAGPGQSRPVAFARR